MTNPSNQEIRKKLEQLANSLATTALSEKRVNELAEAISEAKWPVVGVDVCTVGICIDHRWEGKVNDIDLSQFLDGRFGDIRNIEIFPEGIILPDHARLRTTHAL